MTAALLLIAVLILHGWYGWLWPLLGVLAAIVLAVSVGACVAVWRWWRRPRRFGRG